MPTTAQPYLTQITGMVTGILIGTVSRLRRSQAAQELLARQFSHFTASTSRTCSGASFLQRTVSGKGQLRMFGVPALKLNMPEREADQGDRELWAAAAACRPILL